jgi:hypothetical protein
LSACNWWNDGLGPDAAVHALNPGGIDLDGRFAVAFHVVARTLEIPRRVAGEADPVVDLDGAGREWDVRERVLGAGCDGHPGVSIRVGATLALVARVLHDDAFALLKWCPRQESICDLGLLSGTT